MKKITALTIYTLVIIGGSFLFQDTTWIENALYLGTIILAVGIIAILNPGLKNTKNRRFVEQKMNSEQIQRELEDQLAANKSEIERISLCSIMMYLYLLVPFFIAMGLFVR